MPDTAQATRYLDTIDVLDISGQAAKAHLRWSVGIASSGRGPLMTTAVSWGTSGIGS